MAGKSGRLTFSGRQEYRVEKRRVGYVAVCPCHLGYHFLMPTADGVAEGTINGLGMPYLYPTYADAQAAIEAWQAQREKEAE